MAATVGRHCNKIKHKQPYGYNNIIEKQEKPTI